MTTYRLGRPAGLRSATFRHPHAAQPARARVSQCRGELSNPRAAHHRRAALLGIHGRHRRRNRSCRRHSWRNRLDTHRSPGRPQQHVGRHGGRAHHAGGLDPRHPGARPQEARSALVAPPHQGASGHAEAVPPVVSHRPHRAARRRQAHFRRAERPSPQRADWRWRIEGTRTITVRGPVRCTWAIGSCTRAYDNPRPVPGLAARLRSPPLQPVRYR